MAGLWPDPKALRFSKQEVHGEWVRALGSSDMVLALQGNARLLLPWGKGFWNRVTNISERSAHLYASGILILLSVVSEK